MVSIPRRVASSTSDEEVIPQSTVAIRVRPSLHKVLTA